MTLPGVLSQGTEVAQSFQRGGLVGSVVREPICQVLGAGSWWESQSYLKFKGGRVPSMQRPRVSVVVQEMTAPFPVHEDGLHVTYTSPVQPK